MINSWILNRADVFKYIAMFIDAQNDLSLATGSLFKLAPDFPIEMPLINKNC